MKKQGLLLLLLLLLVIGAVFAFQLRGFNERVEKLPLPVMSMTGLEDGSYTGEYVLDPYLAVELVVTIGSERVTDIVLLHHEHGFGKGAELVLDRVIETNRLSVDVVSGATASSKALMYAIVDAVEKADEK